MNKSVKFVYCDIGGVLFDESGTDQLATDYGIDLDKFRVARANYLDDDQMLSSIMQDISGHVNIENYNEYWTQNSKPYLIGQKMLTKIADHYPIGLLTNNMKDSLSYYVNYGHVPDLQYDVVIQSSELGVKKPDREIYEIAEREARESGENILFIDDRQINLEGAQKLNWQVMWFDRLNQDEYSKKILKYLKI
jgi:putative hydrolase of the HAD superfamily